MGEQKFSSTNMLFSASGFLTGIVATSIFFLSLSNTQLTERFFDRRADHQAKMEADPSHTSGHGDFMTMNDMVQALDGLQGRELELAFLDMMIDHHKGAVEMAQRLDGADIHPQLTQMAESIITTQTEEISRMQQWRNGWGY